MEDSDTEPGAKPVGGAGGGTAPPKEAIGRNFCSLLSDFFVIVRATFGRFLRRNDA